MPLITATASWQSATLVQDEIWQNRAYGRAVLLTVEAPSGDDDLRGIRLEQGEVRIFRAGQTVRWRCATTPDVDVLIQRELHQ
ncbi:hypothetical protein D2N39_22255 [Gemmobacter lutimaris]|uniref:Uncharacterized protein n=1 Tax=Gemmobacter lutimaris TaxID=2306023 RepID=A0A398BGU9_9RHOB|nr:hypothetical protein [Gemmobacter lutimaris]RID89629.1 hypothetical protein D2N39_22255 [Gemmobacter lutimaris]